MGGDDYIVMILRDGIYRLMIPTVLLKQLVFRIAFLLAAWFVSDKERLHTRNINVTLHPSEMMMTPSTSTGSQVIPIKPQAGPISTMLHPRRWLHLAALGLLLVLSLSARHIIQAQELDVESIEEVGEAMFEEAEEMVGASLPHLTHKQ